MCTTIASPVAPPSTTPRARGTFWIQNHWTMDTKRKESRREPSKHQIWIWLQRHNSIIQTKAFQMISNNLMTGRRLWRLSTWTICRTRSRIMTIDDTGDSPSLTWISRIRHLRTLMFPRQRFCNTFRTKIQARSGEDLTAISQELKVSTIASNTRVMVKIHRIAGMETRVGKWIPRTSNTAKSTFRNGMLEADSPTASSSQLSAKMTKRTRTRSSTNAKDSRNSWPSSSIPHRVTLNSRTSKETCEETIPTSSTTTSESKALAATLKRPTSRPPIRPRH